MKKRRESTYLKIDCDRGLKDETFVCQFFADVRPFFLLVTVIVLGQSDCKHECKIKDVQPVDLTVTLRIHNNRTA